MKNIRINRYATLIILFAFKASICKSQLKKEVHTWPINIEILNYKKVFRSTEYIRVKIINQVNKTVYYSIGMQMMDSDNEWEITSSDVTYSNSKVVGIHKLGPTQIKDIKFRLTDNPKQKVGTKLTRLFILYSFKSPQNKTVIFHKNFSFANEAL